MRLDSLCTDSAMDCEPLYTPIHVHKHLVIIHECKTMMTIPIMCVQLTTVLPCKFCMKCCSREIFSSWAGEFLNWKKILLKLMVHHSGKFAPRGITHFTVYS